MRLQGEYLRNAMINIGDGYYDAMVVLIMKIILSDICFSNLVNKVVSVDAAIVKVAEYSGIRSYSILACSDAEQSLCRLHNVVAAWCLKNPEPIPYSPTV